MSERVYTSGEGYEYVSDDETGKVMYLHRLVAYAEHGAAALDPSNDVHHKEMWDGRSVPFLNAREWVEPVEKWEHRNSHLAD